MMVHSPGRLTTPKSLGVTVRMRDCDTAGLAGVLDARRLFFGLAGLLALFAFEPAAAREPVSLVTVESRQLEERLPLTGTLTAKRAALLSTSVSGLVTALNVDLGDRME
jgi:membrane fusion protein, multidrug efflux system